MKIYIPELDNSNKRQRISQQREELKNKGWEHILNPSKIKRTVLSEWEAVGDNPGYEIFQRSETPNNIYQSILIKEKPGGAYGLIGGKYVLLTTNEEDSFQVGLDSYGPGSIVPIYDCE